MTSKKMAKGKMAPNMKKKKQGKEKKKSTFISKEKGSILKHSTKKKSMSDAKAASSDILTEKMSLFKGQSESVIKKKAKNLNEFTQPEGYLKDSPRKQIKKKHELSSPKTATKGKERKMKRKLENKYVKSMKATKSKKEMDASEDVAVTNDKRKKKRRELARGDGPAAGELSSAAAAGTGGAAGQPARLTVAGGFSWETTPWPQSGPAAPAADSSDDDDETEQQRAAAEERDLVERERRLMDPSRAPETADDHERLVVAHPDDSSLWIRFMSYFLQATEIEKARGVARRALKTINFREEDEKLNVYVAWLNLESMHGTQETLSNVLHEALQYNDTFKVYTRMAEIHQANNKHDEAELMYSQYSQLEAELMYSQLVKKLPARKEAWLRYGVFLMQVERREAARALMQRALKCLERRDHVEVISKFAQLEFRFGEPERGKTMFDHLLATYPKRLDQWNVYINQLIKVADYDAARVIFQRAATVRLNARRTRSLLKRFLEFEEAHGSAEQQEAVRELARQYVEARSDADAALLDEPAR
ncbi:Protein RRP5 [Amphibalanus amphitrite]|uniref:Protein RRP5 n=1 Tax=Amphibalanus amphitrite TaxID=1232801 RepID=A0A6A4VQ42_AMPAM|nr:Protein RRP5 [Amphibalanus amphitrite]